MDGNWSESDGGNGMFNEAMNLCRLGNLHAWIRKFKIKIIYRRKNENAKKMSKIYVENSKVFVSKKKLTTFSICLANFTPQQVLLVEWSSSHCELWRGSGRS